MRGKEGVHKQLEMNENFAVFLMYRPNVADAIYVPLWKFRWGFEASLSNTGTINTPWWELDSDSFKDPIAQGPTTQFPTWTTTVQALSYQPEA
ncbi:MAG TPA: hypothetical protein VF170_12800 [Planctomycetaceae bacterium]